MYRQQQFKSWSKMNNKKLKEMGIEKRKETIENEEDLIPINKRGRKTLLNNNLKEIKDKVE